MSGRNVDDHGIEHPKDDDPDVDASEAMAKAFPYPNEPDLDKERREQEKAYDEYRQLQDSHFTSWQPQPPQPPPPPPPKPEDDYDPTWGTEDDDDDLPEGVIKIEGDSGGDNSVEEGLTMLGTQRSDPPPPPPPVVDDDVRRAANEFIPEQFLRPDAKLNTEPKASPRPIVPIVVGALLLVGVIGFAATRGDSGQGSAATAAPAPALPTTTSAPLPTAAAPTVAATVPIAAGPRVTDTKITEQGNVCLNQTTFIFTATIVGAKAGDAVHVKITGPGLPSEANGTLGADGTTVTGVIGVTGPVKGNQMWSAQVDQIAGKPIVSGPSQVFGFCPTS